MLIQLLELVIRIFDKVILSNIRREETFSRFSFTVQKTETGNRKQ